MSRGTVWLIAGLLSAAACYPDPNDLRGGGRGSGGQVGSSGGSTGAGGALTGTGGRAGASGGTGGRLGTGGMGLGGRAGTGGAGVGGSGTGGSSAGRCGAPPCGGDLVGTWDVVQSCASPTMDNPNCPGETVSYAGIQRVGFITFKADLTYASSVTDSGTFVRETPTSCLALDGVTCADLDAAYRLQTQPPSPTLLSASCTSTTVSCRCVLGFIPQSSTDSGFYGTSGTKITITSTVDSSTATDDYCVTGTTMRLIFPDSTPSAPQETVFQRR